MLEHGKGGLYGLLKVPELKKELARRGLDPIGTRSELTARLAENDESEAKEEAPADDDSEVSINFDAYGGVKHEIPDVTPTAELPSALAEASIATLDAADVSPSVRPDLAADVVPDTTPMALDVWSGGPDSAPDLGPVVPDGAPDAAGASHGSTVPFGRQVSEALRSDRGRVAKRRRVRVKRRSSLPQMLGKVCAHLGLDYESLVFRLHAQMTAAAREDQAPKTPQAEAVEFVEKTKSLGFRVEMPDIEHDRQAQQAEAAESGESAEKTECLGFRVEMPDIEHEHQAPKPLAEAESVEPLEKTESLGFREMEMPNVEPEHQETAEEALEAAWAAHTGSPGSEADVGQPVPTQDEPEDLDDSTLLEIEALKTQVEEAMRRTARAQMQLRRKKAEEFMLAALAKHCELACKVYKAHDQGCAEETGRRPSAEAKRSLRRHADGHH
ncbi:unnamed protein product [Effrenium voratum]|nr:unnamed protein product [Effrenium voratum]